VEERKETNKIVLNFRKKKLRKKKKEEKNKKTLKMLSEM
jgi:hypothetical protein